VGCFFKKGHFLSATCTLDSNSSGSFRRDEVLATRHKLAAKAKELKITDPSKVILSAIPRYDSGGKHVKLRKIINEAENNATAVPKHEWDQGEEGTTRISIVEVMDKARQQRRRELDRTPAVYLDD
jgi:hypothetical protein